MAKLFEDIERYADEAFNKGDVEAGLKLIGEISGIVTLTAIAVVAITVWIPGLNIVIPGGVLAKGLSMAAREYSNMDKKQRKQVRAVARFASGRIDGLVKLFN